MILPTEMKIQWGEHPSNKFDIFGNIKLMHTQIDFSGLKETRFFLIAQLT